MNPAGLDFAEIEREIGQDGIVDFREEAAEFHFGIFIGQHILGGSACFFSNPVEEMGVHVRAYSESEDAGKPLRLFLYRLEDAVEGSFANRRQSIGEENNQLRTVRFFVAGFQSGFQSVMDRSATDRLQI